MKKTRGFLIGLLFALLACLFAVSAVADEPDSIIIAGHNLSLDDSITMIYYVDFPNVPNEAEKGLLIWTDPQESYTYGTEFRKLTDNNGTYQSYLRYDLTGIAAKMMAQDIYAVPFIKDGENITYGNLDKYSVLQYCYNKKNSSATANGGSGTLGQLVNQMLIYGADAQRYFNYRTDRLANATYYQVTVVDGTLPDGTTKGLYQENESVVLTANAALEGKEFSYWQNSLGQNVGTEQTLTVLVSSNKTLTAIYGEAIPEPEPEPEYSVGLAFINGPNDTCYVSGIGICTDTDIVIPNTSPEGKRVNYIGSNAFQNCIDLTSITIPDSVTSIGEATFSNCSGLTSIMIPDSVTSIGRYAFSGCTSLTSIAIPESVTIIGDYAFSGCAGLTSFTIPDSVTSIGWEVFYNCISLTSITIPDSVTSIENSAFSGCTGLTSITIPNSVTNIGWDAFHDCSNLMSITIGNSVTSIGDNAFYGCSGLTSITIPDGVTSIGNWAFYNCSRLTSITIPDSVTIIGGYAFSDCTGLTSITIGNGVTSIGGGAFRNCSNLISITIPDSVTNTNIESTFYNCSGLTSITIPDSVTSIGSYAFAGCSGLTNITFSGTIEQWNAIGKESGWNSNTGPYTIHCTDGDIAKE